MWPSHRLFWPPSRSLRADGGVGKKGVPTRKYGSAHLQGSWRPCGAEHAGPEHGFGCACGRRCKTSGGGRDKERTYPNWLALELGHVWWFLLWRLVVDGLQRPPIVSQFAKAKARSEPFLMRRRMEQAWRLRWTGLLACAAARSFAASLLGLHGGRGADGLAPSSHEVECDHRFAGLSG